MPDSYSFFAISNSVHIKAYWRDGIDETFFLCEAAHIHLANWFLDQFNRMDTDQRRMLYKLVNVNS
jgi:hypothetical protein